MCVYKNLNCCNKARKLCPVITCSCAVVHDPDESHMAKCRMTREKSTNHSQKNQVNYIPHHLQVFLDPFSRVDCWVLSAYVQPHRCCVWPSLSPVGRFGSSQWSSLGRDQHWTNSPWQTLMANCWNISEGGFQTNNWGLIVG